MPSRNVVFEYDKVSTNKQAPVFGVYSGSNFKAWGNKLVDGSEESLLGRRFSDSDRTCMNRNT